MQENPRLLWLYGVPGGGGLLQGVFGENEEIF